MKHDAIVTKKFSIKYILTNPKLIKEKIINNIQNIINVTCYLYIVVVIAYRYHYNIITCQGKLPNPASSPPTILRCAPCCLATETPQPRQHAHTF